MGSDSETDEDFLDRVLYEVSWDELLPESASEMIMERFKR